MTIRLRDPANWWNSLRVRLVVMMSLALLPIGLIAISQTRAVSEKARRNTELAMLSLVEQSALLERLAVQRALGAAEAIALRAPALAADPAACSAWMADLVASSQRFSFAGILPLSGQVVCSSADAPFDLSPSPAFQELMLATTPQVAVNPSPRISGTPIINISAPIQVDDKTTGMVSISVPLSKIDNDDPTLTAPGLTELITFNNDGEVMTFIGENRNITASLPVGIDLTGLTISGPMAFSSFDKLDRERIYAVVPIEPGQLYALGIWDAEMGIEAQVGTWVSPVMFPALMWLTSLTVVLFAIHRLVSRHVRTLRRQMVRFARDRAMPTAAETGEMPSELVEIQQSFTAMAYSIVQDEAALEDAVREKNVLIREVHHRVKNNLQLISSIVNMQIRNASNTETQSVLRRVQDRVLSLATIHRDLYQSNTAGQVNVGNLVREVIEKTVEIGAATETSLDVESNVADILLYPDQAVPMSLLAAEAATNAMKYASAPVGQVPWIKASFTAQEGAHRVFRIANSVGGETAAEGTGLGDKLIRAFGIQLGADIDVVRTDHDYTLTVTFDATDFVPERAAY